MIIGDIPDILDKPNRTTFVLIRGERLANWVRTGSEGAIAHKKACRRADTGSRLIAERPFQWARCVSATSLLERKDPVYD